jgi:hypothetical protein
VAGGNSVLLFGFYDLRIQVMFCCIVAL